jgi:hypothetical protein
MLFFLPMQLLGLMSFPLNFYNANAVVYGNDRFMTVGNANVGTIAGTITGAGCTERT